MSRPLRIECPGALYHVTSRGNARRRIYRDDEDRAAFLSILAHGVDRYGWLCHAYCVMDNHYHLLIETPKPNLSRGMRHVNGWYTQAHNRRHRRVGHLFQGRFKAILVEKEGYLLSLCRYVVLNPVRAKMVTHPEHWPWSSYRATAGEAAPPDYLVTDWILGQFGNRLHEAQTRYRQYVAEGIGASSPWDTVQGQMYLGSKDFVRAHQPDRVIREVPRQHTQAYRPELQDIFGGQRDQAQGILEAYRRYGYRMIEIAEHLGVHYATVSRRLRRTEQADV